jgi:GxxExxY protein
VVKSFTTKNTEKIKHKGHKRKSMTENEIANKIIGIAIDVHKALGSGLLESAYKECLYYKVGTSGLLIEKEKPIPLVFEEVKLDCGYRLDLLVEKKLVIEVKSVEALNDIHLAQTLTYLKLGNFKLGLLINFNVVLLKEGIKRVINGTL